MDDLEEVQQSSGTTESGGPAQSVKSVPSESSMMQSMFLQFLNEFEQCREDEERRKEQRREDEERRKEQHWEERLLKELTITWLDLRCHSRSGIPICMGL